MGKSLEMVERSRRRMKLVDELSSMRQMLTNVSRSKDLLPTERVEMERTAGKVDELSSQIFRATG